MKGSKPSDEFQLTRQSCTPLDRRKRKPETVSTPSKEKRKCPRIRQRESPLKKHSTSDALQPTELPMINGAEDIGQSQLADNNSTMDIKKHLSYPRLNYLPSTSWNDPVKHISTVKETQHAPGEVKNDQNNTDSSDSPHSLHSSPSSTLTPPSTVSSDVAFVDSADRVDCPKDTDTTDHQQAESSANKDRARLMKLAEAY